MLIALANGRPDRLPCQVHSWMPYYLEHYLGGMDEWQAFEKFGMDFAIYRRPEYIYDPKDLARWEVKGTDLGLDHNGNKCRLTEIITPKGTLQSRSATTDITTFDTEYLLKSERDFEIWNEFLPQPVGIDLTPVREARERLGDRGIIRSHTFNFGQGAPWQSFCTLYGTENSILLGMDQPDLLHHILDSMSRRKSLRISMLDCLRFPNHMARFLI
jgi:hypothetical protein